MRNSSINYSREIHFFIIGIIAISFIFNSCSKDEDINPGNIVPEDIRSVNNFIWDNMDVLYLWKDFMPTNLDPNDQPDPINYFKSLLYSKEDKWSFITDDYEGLVNSLQGINKTFGHEFALWNDTTKNEVYGIVEYVIKDSPANTNGIKRGDIFNRINGVQLDTINYRSLLFGSDSYTVGFADLVEDEIIPNDKEIELMAVVMQEYPVFLDTVLNVEGKKIGYLVYNQFISSLNSDLDDVFTMFKSEGISDLVVDLRYNPGGSVGTATLMASLIAPSNVSSQKEIFTKFIWNDIVDQYWRDTEGENSSNLVIPFINTPNNVNMSKVYFLVSGNSASSSELVINGLKPYMDVILIGINTHGKYTASVTLHEQETSFNWAIQPIVLKTANAEDETDYKDGFSPDYFMRDDYFSPLGSLEENMLAQAISLITGKSIDQLTRKKGYNKIELNKKYFLSGGRYRREQKIIMEADNINIY